MRAQFGRIRALLDQATPGQFIEDMGLTHAAVAGPMQQSCEDGVVGIRSWILGFIPPKLVGLIIDNPGGAKP
jgi:hypothetical protein